MDVAGHDSNFALLGLDDSWAIGPYDSGLGLGLESVLDLDHVLLWDTICDDYNKGNFGSDCFHDCFGCSWRRHVDHARIALGMLFGLLAVLEYGQSQVCCSCFLRRNSSNHFRSIGESLLGLKGALVSRHALADDFGITIYPDVGFAGGEKISNCPCCQHYNIFDGARGL